MSVHVQFFLDFVCPYCYLANEAFTRVSEGRGGVELEYCPRELRRPPQPHKDPMNEEGKLERFHEELVPMAKELGVTIELPPISPHPYTTLAFQGFYFAKEQGGESEYCTRTLRAFFRDSRNIGVQAVVESILSDMGFDTTSFAQAVSEGRWLDQLERDVDYVKEKGVRGIPTFFFNGKAAEGPWQPAEFETLFAEAQR